MKKNDKIKPVYIESFDRDRQKLLQSLGVPGADMISAVTKFDVVDFLVSMEPDLPGVHNKPISTKKQASLLRKILNDPLAHPYVIGISSYPSDTRAKQLAQTIMSAAIDSYETNRRRQGVRSRPLWHRVWGNLNDSLRDRHKENPSLLVLSNLNDESSSVKIEKVRDLLEMYSDIPRIVVAGGRPIIDMFSYRLSMSAHAAFYIGPQNLVRENI